MPSLLAVRFWQWESLPDKTLSGCSGFQPAFHHIVIHDSSLLMHELVAGEDDEVRNAAHVVSSGELWVLLRIDLQDERFSSHRGRCACDVRSCHVTGTAPVGPEVDQNWNASSLDDLVEEGSIDLQWFIYRRQGSLACAAAARIGEVVCANAVLLATALTGSYCWHRKLLLRTKRVGDSESRTRIRDSEGTAWLQDAGARPTPVERATDIRAPEARSSQSRPTATAGRSQQRRRRRTRGS